MYPHHFDTMNALSAVLLVLAMPFLALSPEARSDKRPVGLRSLDFDAAKSAARAEKRPVMVLFCDGENDCRRIAEDMLKEIKLRTWLDDKVVAIQIDARTEVDLARQYRIRTTPVFLFTDDKGTEMDRLVGARDSKTLRKDGEEILAGGDALERLQKRRKGRETDPEMRLRYADILCDRGELDRALAEYMAVHAQGGPMADAAFDELMRMRLLYPKAADAIAGIAGTLEPRIRSGDATDEEFERWFSLCRKLKSEMRMLGMYDGLAPIEGDDLLDPPLDPAVTARKEEFRKRMAPALRDIFYTDRRYSDYAALVTDSLADFDARKTKHAAVLATGDASATKTSLDRLRDDTARDYEALIGVRRLGEATLLADALIGFDTTVRTYDLLIEYALRAERPGEARLLATRGRSDARIDAKQRVRIGPSIQLDEK